MKEVPNMSNTILKLCVKSHIFRSMHFMFDTVTSNVEVLGLSSNHIEAARREIVINIGKKESNSRVIEESLVGICIPMEIKLKTSE